MRITTGQEGRILQLAREGVPDAWIAEEMGLSVRCVANYRRGASIPASEGWKLERLFIQHNPRLFDLHLQFAPKSLQRA